MTTMVLPRTVLAIVVATLFLLCFHFINGQNLTATLSTARLPTGRSHIAAWYDNDDSIYLFGGFEYKFRHTETFKYSISSDTLENAGHLPRPTFGSSVIQNKFGDIYHLSGGYDVDDVYQYFPDNQSFIVVSRVPLGNAYFATVRSDEDTALLFVGVEYAASFGVHRMNLSNLNFEKINDFPERNRNPTAIWVKDSAYIFGGRCTYKYHRTANQFEALPTGDPFNNDPIAKAVSDGKNGYIIGGVNNFQNNILRFDWELEILEPVRVLGYPFVEALYFGSTAAVYVEKVNRIYLFGGVTEFPVRFRDEIWYINLD